MMEKKGEQTMKNGLQEILSTGIVPAVRVGKPAVDPESCFAKAPKAFREIERGVRRSKRGTDARDISKLFGMSVDTIKKAWAMCAVLFCLLSARAGNDLVIGSGGFVDGQTVHASDLNNAVNNATIQPTFITLKPTEAAPQSSDYLLTSSGGTLYKILMGALFLNNTNIVVSQPLKAVPQNADSFTIYDYSSGLLKSTTLNDLFNTRLFSGTNTDGSASSLTAWFDYAYIYLPPTNLPPASNYLNNDFFLLYHDTNAPGSQTNYGSQALSAAGLFTNQNAEIFPLFPFQYTNQVMSNGFGVSTGTVFIAYTPASTNAYVPTPVVSNGVSIYQPTNSVWVTNTSVAQVSLLQLFNLFKALNPTVLFTSTNYPIPASAGLTVIPHGLGVVPSQVRPRLICTTNDANTGYVVGNELDLSEAQTSGAQNNLLFGWYCDANNVYIQSIAASAALKLLNTNGSGGFVTPTKTGSFLFKVYASP